MGECTYFCGRQATEHLPGIKTRQGVGGWRNGPGPPRSSRPAPRVGAWGRAALLSGQGDKTEAARRVGRGCGADPAAPGSEWHLLNPHRVLLLDVSS